MVEARQLNSFSSDFDINSVDFSPLEIDVEGFSGLQASLTTAGLGRYVSKFQELLFNVVNTFLKDHEFFKITIPVKPNGDALILFVPNCYLEQIEVLADILASLNEELKKAFQYFLNELPSREGITFSGNCTFHIAKGELFIVRLIVGQRVLRYLCGAALDACKLKGKRTVLTVTDVEGNSQEYPLQSLNILNNSFDIEDFLGELKGVQVVTSSLVENVLNDVNVFRYTAPTCSVKLPGDDASHGAQKVRDIMSVLHEINEDRESVILFPNFGKVDMPYHFFQMEIASGAKPEDVFKSLNIFLRRMAKIHAHVAISYSDLTMMTYVSGGLGYDPASPALSNAARLLNKKTPEGLVPDILLDKNFLDLVFKDMGEYNAQAFKGVGELLSVDLQFSDVDHPAFSIEDVVARKLIFTERDLQTKNSLLSKLKDGQVHGVFHVCASSGNGASAFGRNLYRSLCEDIADGISLNQWMVEETNVQAFLRAFAQNIQAGMKNIFYIEMNLWKELSSEDKLGIAETKNLSVVVLGGTEEIPSEVFALDESDEKFTLMLEEKFSVEKKDQSRGLLRSNLDALKRALIPNGLSLTVRYMVRFVLPNLKFNESDQWDVTNLNDSSFIQKNKREILQTDFGLQNIDKKVFIKDALVGIRGLLYGDDKQVGLKWLAMFAKSGLWCSERELNFRLFGVDQLSDDALLVKKAIVAFMEYDAIKKRYRVPSDKQQNLMYLYDGDLDEAFNENYLTVFGSKVFLVLPNAKHLYSYLYQGDSQLPITHQEEDSDFLGGILKFDAADTLCRVKLLLQADKLKLSQLDTLVTLFRRARNLYDIQALAVMLCEYIEASNLSESLKKEWQLRAFFLLFEGCNEDKIYFYVKKWSFFDLLNALDENKRGELVWKVCLLTFWCQSYLSVQDSLPAKCEGEDRELAHNGELCLTVENRKYTLIISDICSLKFKNGEKKVNLPFGSASLILKLMLCVSENILNHILVRSVVFIVVTNLNLEDLPRDEADLLTFLTASDIPDCLKDYCVMRVNSGRCIAKYKQQYSLRNISGIEATDMTKQQDAMLSSLKSFFHSSYGLIFKENEVSFKALARPEDLNQEKLMSVRSDISRALVECKNKLNNYINEGYGLQKGLIKQWYGMWYNLILYLIIIDYYRGVLSNTKDEFYREINSFHANMFIQIPLGRSLAEILEKYLELDYV